jgi:hypothetical protein
MMSEHTFAELPESRKITGLPADIAIKGIPR